MDKIEREHIEEADEVLAKNAVRWVGKYKDIPTSRLFVQWLMRRPATGFKAMVKESGSERYYEVTYDGTGSGYDIITYERKGILHGT